MYKILCVSGRDNVRFNQVVQIESMRFDTLEYARKAIETLSGLFTETVFELLDLDAYAEKSGYCFSALMENDDDIFNEDLNGF